MSSPTSLMFGEMRLKRKFQKKNLQNQINSKCLISKFEMNFVDNVYGFLGQKNSTE